MSCIFTCTRGDCRRYLQVFFTCINIYVTVFYSSVSLSVSTWIMYVVPSVEIDWDYVLFTLWKMRDLSTLFITHIVFFAKNWRGFLPKEIRICLRTHHRLACFLTCVTLLQYWMYFVSLFPFLFSYYPLFSCVKY